MVIGNVFETEIDGKLYLVLIKEQMDVHDGVPLYEGILEEIGTMLVVYGTELIGLDQEDEKVKAFKEKAEQWETPGNIADVYGNKINKKINKVKRGIFKGRKVELNITNFELSNYMHLLNDEGEVVAELYSDGTFLK